MQKQIPKLREESFISQAMSRKILHRAIKVALIVGTILAFINHGDKILEVSLTSDDIFKIMLTYIVPYCVSTWSSVRAINTNLSKLP